METVLSRRRRGTQVDEEVSMACQEEAGRPVLLASSRSGQLRQDTIRGDSGQATFGNASGHEEGKAKATATPRQSDAGDKGRVGKGRRRRGQVDKAGKSVGRNERADIPSGRSAQELGIVWPEDRCEESPVTKAHHFVERTRIDRGHIFECIYCHTFKWLPGSDEGARQLGNFFQIYGYTEGYRRILNRCPRAKRMLSKMQDVQYLRKSLGKEHFLVAVAAIVLDREYPYDVEIEEADIL